MFFHESTEPRLVEGVTLLGPDLFAKDEEGKPLSPIACAFPSFAVLVTGRGIHAAQVMRLMEHLKEKAAKDGSSRDPDLEGRVLRDMVALHVRDPVVLIRSDPEDMEQIFAADALLQKLLPKKRIQFTGIHLAGVREQLRGRGESWRISPPPRSVEEMEQRIQSSRVQVATGATFFQNALTGVRYITYEELCKIRPLLRENPAEARARLREILDLLLLNNKEGLRELLLFLPSESAPDEERFREQADLLGEAASAEEMDRAEILFDRFASWFAEAAGPELMIDSSYSPVWRTTIFCRLNNINEKEMEEWALNLSPEFHLNVRWLPGARVKDRSLEFEADAEPMVRSLIRHYFHTPPEPVSINVGRVESPLTERDLTSEQREVYLVVLGRPDLQEDIRFLRMIKWDVIHRINRGLSLQQALDETMQYREYVFDRLEAAAKLGILRHSFSEIRFEAHFQGLGSIPVIFFDRPYIPGMATDKIPPALYGRKGFMVRLAELLGKAAGTTLVLGRASPLSGQVFFDDGDEVVQLDSEGFPERLVVVEITGSFTDWNTSMPEILPHCILRFRNHLDRAREAEIDAEELQEAVHAFARGLAEEIERMQRLYHDASERFIALFDDRAEEPGGIRCRWAGLLNRLADTNTDGLMQQIAYSPLLEAFRPG